jgi:uncharacterized protein DUF6544
MSRASPEGISRSAAGLIVAALSVGVIADRTMNSGPSLDDLWASAPASARVWLPSNVSHLPDPARRYLTHAMAPGTPLASAVRLRMHGEIKLKGWLPFTAEQVIRSDGEMLWQATVRQKGIPIRGFDRLVGGEGAMRWKLLGIVPVMTASGPDITRSTVGRLLAELVWLPSALCAGDVAWTASDALHPTAAMTLLGHAAQLEMTVGETGRLETIKTSRWGNPEGGEFRSVDFGAVAEEEATFDGYTIPIRLRVGWHFVNGRFESDGEFFRGIIDDATFR